MQSAVEYQLLGIILIIVGFLLLIVGTIYLFRAPNLEHTSHKESKGVILLGPIPIVWGFGKKGRIIAFILFTILISICIILFFF